MQTHRNRMKFNLQVRPSKRVTTTIINLIMITNYNKLYSQFLSFLVLEFLLAIFRVNLPTGAGNCRKHNRGYERWLCPALFPVSIIRLCSVENLAFLVTVVP